MKNLKKVIPVRHGDYDRNTGALTEKGKAEIQELAEAICSLIGDLRPAVIFTSTRQRAKETTAIIEEKIVGTTRVECDFLTGDDFTDGDLALESILKSITDDHQAVIIVTHFEAPSGVVHAFSNKKFTNPFRRKTIPTGTGFVLCMETGEIKQIPS